jgi:Uma2 family endonuclease
MQHAIVSTLDESDYLTGEALSPIRHEYVDGHVYAMAGASKAHNLIAGNIFSRLRQHLRGSPCRAFVADMKVKVEASRAYYYPDVVVTCAGQDTAASGPRDYLTAPALIVEVLSETTENIDRREKMRAYGLIDSLREYLLVDSRKAQAELYRKRAEGGWDQWIVTPEDTLTLDSVMLDLTVAELYEDTDLVAQEHRTRSSD